MILKQKAKTALLSLLLAAGLGMSGNPMIDVLAAEPGDVPIADEAGSGSGGSAADGIGSGSGDSVADGSGGEGATSPVEITVPIFNYDVLNVLVSTSYSVALNPYGLGIRIGEGDVSEAQVLSPNYGIVNKSTRDKLVTIVLTVEDLNEGQIRFVDSPEEALNAEEGVYAVYLALVPAGQGEIQVDGQSLDKDVTTEALAKVFMEKSAENAVALKEGENRAAFILSGAEYGFTGAGLGTDADGNAAGAFEFTGLAADGTGVTAFTFDGVMNPDADWSKLTRGIKLSVVYMYDNTTGTEVIAEGTGAMVNME